MLNLNLSGLSNHTTRDNFCKTVVNKIGDVTAPDYTKLAVAIKEASSQLLPKQNKPQPGWFTMNYDKLMPLIDKRNHAMKEVFNRKTRSATKRLKKARKELKDMIKISKNDWIDKHCEMINRHEGTKKSWDSLKALRSGLSKTKVSVTRQMKKADGSFCTTPEENAEVFQRHFEQLYDRQENFDITVLESLPQHDVVQGCDHVPNDDEIRMATLKLKNTAPGESGIRPQLWKSLLENATTALHLQTIIRQIWITENIPNEWNTGCLTVLPKKGDLSLPKNYRGIMLLEVAYKIIAIILHSRLLPIQEGLDNEPQCGFRP